MKMRSLLASAIVLLAVSVSSTLHADAPKTLLHLPFEGSPDAAQAAGQPKPLVANDLSYAPGVKGQAVRISPASLLEYAAAGNLVQERGTVLLWFKPNWRATDMGSDSKDWHCLFYERVPDGVERVGSGALWLWFWGQYLRGDISDINDLYKTAGTQGLDPSKWACITLTWDIKQGSRLYMNAVEVGKVGDGNSPLDVKKAGNFSALAGKFNSFYVGSQGSMARADGFIDELKIFDRALTRAEIAAEMAAISPLQLDCLTPFLLEGDTSPIRWTLINASAGDTTCSWKLVRAGGEVIAGGEQGTTVFTAGERRTLATQLPSLKKGEYRLIVQPAQGAPQSATIWVLGRENPYLKSSGKLETTLVETIDLTQGVLPERLVVRGQSRTASLAGRAYYETGSKKNDRVAVKVKLPEAGVPYLIEWDYPDDKVRTMEMVAQDATNPDNDYGLQCGIFCGDEYPNSMKMLTHRSILWARSQDAAFIFMTVRDNAPAAVSALRISRVIGGLPDGQVHAAAPVGGWTRTLGIHFEDPALGYDFGLEGQLMPQYEQTLDRLVAYMKWSGQNLLSYPAVWYHGRMGPGYQPRIHEDDFIACILTKFAANGLSFMPAINLHNIVLPDTIALSEKSFADGSLHSSPVMILASGKPNPGQFHGSPPNFNPLHPAVQQYVNEQVDDLLDRYAGSPAFKGVVFHLTKHTIPWFGAIEAGYNDYCIEAFERETGIKVAVDRQDPLRGKRYYDWLMANAREPWVQWRCREVAKWYRSIADRISARRPDLKLNLFSYSPTITDFAADPRYGSPGFAMAINRESGIDPALYQDAQNIILTQTIYPADYRSNGADHKSLEKTVRTEHFQESTYALLPSAKAPWINMHDRYFEDGIGGARWWGKNDPLKADWLRETPWRVSVLNANHRFFLEHYVLPLRFGDILGYTKGGFVIGTAGVEEPLLAFSRAYRPLPASRFSDLTGSTATTKARVLKTPQGTWYYAVNTSSQPVSFSFMFDRAPGMVTDLASGEMQSLDGMRHRVQVAAYELRSFKVDSPAGPTEITWGAGAR